ncbi:hypothetical protein DDE83_000358 [Stemphylium lycopersici]|uniref:Uncharacterized protein n=1 Tax=Stemphylium lycopersici TaxID=183478 RepID=A0A364NG43_STELY|nr:hypothetical protein DDE83_000358 [Stemphylium lycopersici]
MFIGSLAHLLALITAVETYLGTNICFAELDLDVFEDHQISVTRDALHALGLRQVHTTRPASRSMTMAQRPDPAPEYDEEPKIILSIGHSPRWYTVDLFMVEDGAIEISFPDFRSSTKMDEEHQLEEIERSLKHIFANSPSNVDLPNGIQELVVYGDDSKNESLGNLLARMLNADLVRDARVSSSAFDGANLTARSVHEDMDRNHVEMRGLSAWGCQWRSALYPASDTISGLREATNDITNTLLGGNQNSNARDEL